MTWPSVRCEPWLLLAAVVSTACVPPRRASSVELHGRAVFDLGCPAQQVLAYPLGPRTRAVSGCGRRLIYVERCDAELGADDACAWLLDTPSFAQVQWPQHLAAQAVVRPQWAEPPASYAPAAALPPPPALAAPPPAPAFAAQPAPEAARDSEQDPLAVPPRVKPKPPPAPPRRRVPIDLF